jgi:hypothetical protein
MAFSDFFSYLWFFLRYITIITVFLRTFLLLISPHTRVNAEDAVPFILDLLRESIVRIHFAWLKYQHLEQRYANLKQRFISPKQAYTSIKRELDNISVEKAKK